MTAKEIQQKLRQPGDPSLAASSVRYCKTKDVDKDVFVRMPRNMARYAIERLGMEARAADLKGLASDSVYNPGIGGHSVSARNSRGRPRTIRSLPTSKSVCSIVAIRC